MLIVQGNNATNIDFCLRIYASSNKIKAETDKNTYLVATFESDEQAQEYLSMILKAYAQGEKVFYC